MAIQYRHEFTVVVEGFGFPLDMLRYDRCTPKTEQDAAAMARSIGSFGVEPQDGLKIRLVHVGERNWNPTFRRWATYGANVVGPFGAPSTDGTARGAKACSLPIVTADYPETRKAS